MEPAIGLLDDNLGQSESWARFTSELAVKGCFFGFWYLWASKVYYDLRWIKEVGFWRKWIRPNTELHHFHPAALLIRLYTVVICLAFYTSLELLFTTIAWWTLRNDEANTPGIQSLWHTVLTSVFRKTDVADGLAGALRSSVRWAFTVWFFLPMWMSIVATWLVIFVNSIRQQWILEINVPNYVSRLRVGCFAYLTRKCMDWGIGEVNWWPFATDGEIAAYLRPEVQ
jgi:hypothetical protein